MKEEMNRPKGRPESKQRGGHDRGGERRFEGRRDPKRGGNDRAHNKPFRSTFRGGDNRPTKPGARDAALEAYRECMHMQAYASQALGRVLDKYQLSDEDRRLAAHLFYTAVERRSYLRWALDGCYKSCPDPLIMDILTIAAAQLLLLDRVPDHAATDEAVKQVRRAHMEGLTGLVNGVLHTLIRKRDEGELKVPEGDRPEDLALQCSLNVDIAQKLIDAYGPEKARSIARISASSRCVTLRPNLMRTTRAAFEAWLTGRGAEWTQGLTDELYIVKNAGNITETDEFRQGLFSVQGTSSAMAAMAVCAAPGMKILDACAAPGGKTCYMAEHMGGAGRVFAWDLHPHRVQLIRAAVRRLGLDNVRPSEHDATVLPESFERAMDAVLVDAPCSGLGVMADKPDIRYKDLSALPELVKLQGEILEACAGAVAPGGLLVYSTCTILPEENVEQVNRFLEKHSEFRLEENTRGLPEALRGRFEGGMVQLLPGMDEAEGFFIARMRRK